MVKKVLVLAGSPHKNGNSSILSDEFIRGATESGHESEKIYIKDQSIQPCLGCNTCQDINGQCIQKDGMQAIYEKLMQADVIVFASPVYFYSWTAQMKTILDRTYALEPKLQNKTFYLISAGAAPEEKYMENMTHSFKLYASCFRAGGNGIGGYLYGLNVSNPGDVKNTDVMKRAYEMGKNS